MIVFKNCNTKMSFVLDSIYPNVTKSRNINLQTSQFLFFLVFPIPHLGRGCSEL